MSVNDRGRTRSLEVTGGPAQTAARSMLRAIGWTTEDLSGDEIAARLAAVEHPPPRYPTGVLAKYARLVGSAATGARVGV